MIYSFRPLPLTKRGGGGGGERRREKKRKEGVFMPPRNKTKTTQAGNRWAS